MSGAKATLLCEQHSPLRHLGDNTPTSLPASTLYSCMLLGRENAVKIREEFGREKHIVEGMLIPWLYAENTGCILGSIASLAYGGGV